MMMIYTLLPRVNSLRCEITDLIGKKKQDSILLAGKEIEKDGVKTFSSKCVFVLGGSNFKSENVL